MGLGTERPHQAKTTFRIGKDPDHAGAAFDLFVESLQHIGAFHGPVMGAGKGQKGECFPNAALNPVAGFHDIDPVHFKSLTPLPLKSS